MKRLKFVLTVTLLSFGLAATSSADLVATDLNDGGADEGFTGDWSTLPTLARTGKINVA